METVNLVPETLKEIESEEMMSNSEEECEDGTYDGNKEFYASKLEYSNGIDPYEIPEAKWSTNLERLPSMSHDNVGRYLMWTPGPLMKPDIGSYTSLELYKMVEDGSLHDMVLTKLDGCGEEECNSHVVVKAKISNAEKLGEKTLQPWVIAEDNGIILSALCDCPIGLTVSCDHLSALLFSIIDMTDPFQRQCIERARKMREKQKKKSKK